MVLACTLEAIEAIAGTNKSPLSYVRYPKRSDVVRVTALEKSRLVKAHSVNIVLRQKVLSYL